MGASKIGVWHGKGGCFCSIPTELLLHIFSYLSVLDFLSVSAVCKCWRTAFLRCPHPSSQIEESRQMPWFVVLSSKENEDLDCELDVPSKKRWGYDLPRLYTTGKLGHLPTGHVHALDIPEMCGTRFLLSRHGWLLLFSSECPKLSSQLFFFNPFSRAKINLPFMDISELDCPVFEVSATPTSLQCIVFVVSCLGESGFEVSICYRGQSAWNTKLYKRNNRLGAVTNVVFQSGLLYCVHRLGFMSVVDTHNWNWRDYDILKRTGYCFEWPMVSYTMMHENGDDDNKMKLCIHTSDGHELILKEPFTCRNPLWDGSSDMWSLAEQEFNLRFDLEKEILNVQGVMKLSSFNIHAWCGKISRGSKNVKEVRVKRFNWHRFRGGVASMWKGLPRRRICEHARGYRTRCSTKIAWFEPTWVHRSPKLIWSSDEML